MIADKKKQSSTTESSAKSRLIRFSVGGESILPSPTKDTPGATLEAYGDDEETFL